MSPKGFRDFICSRFRLCGVVLKSLRYDRLVLLCHTHNGLHFCIHATLAPDGMA